MTAKVLMVQGTSSSAGKSLLVTALCRIFARRGWKVAPFKAQNMSNNAGVCLDGAEIGRAQITQAMAAGIEPTAQMNPVLLKPEANVRSQVVVLGKAWETLAARDYYDRKRVLWNYVTESLDQLRAEYDLVIIEGAGSPAELNLKRNDIVNMAVAVYAQAPVLLVGDIDRGGIFPQLLGTWWLLPEEEQRLIAGFIVNKFRGDPSLFTDGIEIIEEKSDIPVVGVVPWMVDLAIPEEDAVALDVKTPAVFDRTAGQAAAQITDIAIIRLPRIANFDDFDQLAGEPGVRVRYITKPAELAGADAVIIPGTKSTMADLEWLNQAGFAEPLRIWADEDKPLVGICGGYQMLGREIYDPNGVESPIEQMAGLSILPITTSFAGEKATHRATGFIASGWTDNWFAQLDEASVHGYEIHMGRTETETPWLRLVQRGEQQVNVVDGAMRPDGRVWGCYLHGLFGNQSVRHAWLESLGWSYAAESQVAADLETAFDQLANHVEEALDMTLLEKILADQPS